MSLTPWLPVVRKIKDGETVDQSTVNVPLDQLTQREQHLYEKFEQLADKSVLVSFGQPIHPKETLAPGELSLVYFKSDSYGAGLAKGTTGFSSTESSSMFSPKKSNYTFGLVKTVYSQSKTADLYTEGLCELDVNLDDSSLGLIQKQANGVVEPFEVGPYFLSAKSPGKITRDPSGVPVYVGYAISKRKLLLHTNVDEFSQFFINYRYHLLDRVAGIPVQTNNVWTITSPNINSLGWLPVSALDGTKVVIPSGAVFYYNIPAASVLQDAENVPYDAALGASERIEAVELHKYLPPVPANFIQLYVNGTLARYYDAYDLDGDYSVNEYGIWWHTDEDNYQPWSTNYPQDANGAPSHWLTDIQEETATSRKHIFVSFSRFNPALRTQLVSSLKPFNTSANKSSNFIKFYNDGDLLSPSASGTGDLLVDIEAPTTQAGYSDDSAFTYPADIAATYTAGRAVAAFKYDKELGGFKQAITPVVAKITGSNGLTITNQGAGVWNIEYAGQGSTGQVDSIEPINSRLEFKGLFSYIKLPAPSTTPYGLIGKIVLPKGATNNKDLRLVFHVFGDTAIENASIARKVAFQFEYSAASAANGANPSAYTTVTAPTYSPEINPVEFAVVASGAYTQNTSIKLTNASIVVPAAFIREDTVVNFKILRVAVGSVNQSYPGNIGLLATYWEIPNT